MIDPVSEVSRAILINIIEFEYGQILLPLEKTATPFETFKKVSKFDQFLMDIVISQKNLYSQQKGQVFEIEKVMYLKGHVLDEIKTFFVKTAPMEIAKKLKAIQSHSQVVHHTMVKATKRQRCKLCTKNKTSNLTFNKCVECNIHLCFVNSQNCFQTYHDSL